MAARRDIIIGGFIVFVFFGFLLVAALMFSGLGSSDSEVASFTGGNIGLVEVDGVLNEESGRPIIKLLDRWKDNHSIKAIILHVNSPGGGVAISQEIYDAVLRAKEEKPVIASLASVAASGGYYISCGADRIMANPGTITGSIGVIFQFHTATGLLEKIGVGTETVKSGDLKDVGTYARPMSEAEGLMLRSVVMDSYEQFVDVVANGRGLEKDQVYPLADGSVFTGLQAKNLGLVDTLGGLYEAVYLAAELAKVDGEPKVVRPIEKSKVDVWDLLGGLLHQSVSGISSVSLEPQLQYIFK